MASVRKPRRFSEVFGIDPEALLAAGAFDPILNADTRLFLDPLLLDRSAHQEMRDARGTWEQRFSDIIQLLSASQERGDVAWRNADRLFQFPEFSGTCLGYGSGIRGSGMGSGLRARLLGTAKEIVALGIQRPELFALLPLIEDDVGPDRISDMSTRIIARHLEAYTQRVLADWGVELQDIHLNGDHFRLPLNPLDHTGGGASPVVLVPRDVLRDLPTASDWEDVTRIAAENAAYVSQLNDVIGDIWAVHSRRDKALIRQTMLSSRGNAEGMLNTILGVPRDPYDIPVDPEGRVNWLEMGREAAHRNPIAFAAINTKNEQELRQVVDVIVARFVHLLDHNDLWKALWHNGERLPEHHAQLLFFSIADTYCGLADVDVTPEAAAGGGPVDFKFSVGYRGRVLVEVKMSDNRRLRHGYLKQLEIYKQGQRTSDAIYLIVDVGSGGRQVNQVLQLHAAEVEAGTPHSQVIVANGKPRASASKRD